MSDFAGQFATSEEAPPFLHTFMRPSGLWEASVSQGASYGAVSTTWTTANLARYYPISIPFAYPVARVFWVNGSGATGNRTFAIYTADGEQLYTTGSTAASGASVPQFVTPGSALWLPPGDYYFGFNSDLTTNSILGAAVPAIAQRMAGIQQQAVGAVTLPDPWTPAAATVAGANICGVTWTPSGF